MIAMIEVREVSSGKEQRDFLNFPLRMYRDCPYFAPPLYSDEKKIFRKDYVYADTCDSVFFNAYKDGVMAGRISGILQKAANEKYGEKKVRFTRFDAIDDPEVSRALFDALEKWALDKGMDTVTGPLGYSDLEREGLLIEGFDQLSTFEEQYNAEYYQHHIEALGYTKDVDWVESQIRAPKVVDEQLAKTADYLMKRNGLHFAQVKSVNDLLRRYGDKFFDLLDRSYDQIYGTVPFTDGMKKMMISNFKLIMKLKYIALIVNKDDNLVCLGICFPSLAKALQKSGGRLTPAGIVRVLWAINHPKIIDFGLIGVDQAYLKKGVTACVVSGIMGILAQPGVEYAETNLNLEDNYAIRNTWKRFDSVEHKRRRCYIKKLIKC